MCDGMIQWVSKTSSNGKYTYPKQCSNCTVPWALNRAFGLSDQDKRVALGEYEAHLKELEKKPVKDKENEAARNALRGLMADPKGEDQSVMLIGPPGTGKTFLGIHCLAWVIANKTPISGFYLPEHLFFKAWRASHSQDSKREREWGLSVIRRAKAVDILLLDDFGQSRSVSPGAADALESLIMSRYDKKANMIITTNRTPSALKEHRGDRVISRISGMTGGKVVELTCTDWRQR